MTIPHDHIIDTGIRFAVDTLRAAGIETFESCEGGEGHAFAEPVVRFHGYADEGFRAFAAATAAGLDVAALRRYWTVIDNEPSGPHWELVFASATPREAASSRPS